MQAVFFVQLMQVIEPEQDIIVIKPKKILVKPATVLPVADKIVYNITTAKKFVVANIQEAQEAEEIDEDYEDDEDDEVVQEIQPQQQQRRRLRLIIAFCGFRMYY
jgi:type II secretory pathway predicted ATPase ExeA